MKKGIFSDIFEFKILKLLLAIIFLYILFFAVSDYFIFTKSYYYSALSNQFAIARIDKILKEQENQKILFYILPPILLCIKLILISSIIFIGTDLIGNEGIGLKNCFRIVLIAEIVPILFAFVKISYFLIIPPQSLDDVRFFFPLSLIQVFNAKQIPSYLIYPLQLIGFFEIGYWVLLVIGINHFIKKGLKKSFLVLITTYGSALILWILLIAFLQLLYS